MKEEHKKKLKKEVVSLFWCLLIALAFRSFVFEIFQIPSGSMVPSLLVGDMPLVQKWSYGYSKYSIFMNPPIFSNRIFEKPVKRGDVVVFRLPADPDTNYIKRVVGLPGDKVQVLDGIVHVNGQKADLVLIGNYTYHDEAKKGLDHETLLYKEILPGASDRPHTIIKVPSSTSQWWNNTPVYVVPADHYFMMGDNRDFSQDSRFLDKVGFIHKEYLVGRATNVFHSISNGVKIWEFWNWFQNIRYDRILKAIE